MRFPDTVTILRATGTDEYGNPGSWSAAPTGKSAKAFVVREPNPGNTVSASGLILVEPSADVRLQDRIRANGRLYEVEECSLARSASAAKVWSVKVRAHGAQS